MSVYIKQSMWLVVVLFCGLMLNGAVQSASFDCAKAATKVEKFICGDAELSRLDEELNAAYKAAVQDQAQADAIRQAQKRWMKRRNECIDTACIKRAYEAKLAFLKSPAAAPLMPSVETYDNDYVRDLDARTYLPAHVDRQEGDPYEAARDPNVCSLYLQNLQYFARRNIPMSCGQPIAPGLGKSIQKVEWEDLDPDQYPDLFKDNWKRNHVYYKREPIEQELALATEFIRSKKGVFRRAKLDLKGYPSFEYVYGVKPAEAKFNLIQYGVNSTDPNNSEPLFRCEMRQGRVANHGSFPELLIATNDLHKFYWNSMTFMGGSGQNLWLINNYPYLEGYGEDGTVQLSELRVEDPIHFEPVCLYHYKTNLANSGAEK